MLLSVPPCRPHPRLIPPGLLWMPLPPVLAESGLQGFAPTGSPGFNSLGCGLVVCLRSFRFRLATDTLPFSATVRIQLDRQVFHLRENNTAGHTSTRIGSRKDDAGASQGRVPCTMARGAETVPPSAIQPRAGYRPAPCPALIVYIQRSPTGKPSYSYRLRHLKDAGSATH
jgi:hypothetical protein